MDVRFVGTDGVVDHDVADLDALLERTDGFAWIDVPTFDETAEQVLRDVIGCHPTVLRHFATRNHVPTVHAYVNHFFTTLHAPLLGSAGHVHLLELDQVVGTRYLVTVHGPINPVVDPAEALVETEAALRRMQRGTAPSRPRRPSSPTRSGRPSPAGSAG